MNSFKLQLIIFKRILNFNRNVAKLTKGIRCHLTTNATTNERDFFSGYSFKKSFKIKPNYGTIILESDCKCSIFPLNPEEFPEYDHAFITFKSSEKFEEKNIDFRLVGKEMNRIRLQMENIPKSFCEITIPSKYNIEANLKNDADIRIENFDSENIDISTDSGSVNIKQVKISDMNITTNCGKVNFEGLLQGNLYLNGKSMVFNAERLHGTSFQIEADSLEAEIESSYMTEGSIVTRNGNVNIKNLHGSTQLHVTEGNININALHGQLGAFLRKGNCSIQITELLKDSYCEVEDGDIDLHYLNSEGHNIDLFSSTLSISPEFQSKGNLIKIEDKSYFHTEEGENGKPLFKAHAKHGTLSLKIRSWFESLGIKV